MSDPEYPHTLATDHKRRIRVVLVSPTTIELQATDDGPPVANAAHHALHVLAMRILSLEAENASLLDVQGQAARTLAGALEDVNPETVPLVTLATRVTKALDWDEKLLAQQRGERDYDRLAMTGEEDD